MDLLSLVDLSDWFNPFLPHFVRESLACGGRVRVVREDDTIVAVLLTEPPENVASIFTRSRSAAKMLRGDRTEAAVFCELDLEGPREAFEIYISSVPPSVPPHRFRHRIQIAPADEIPAVMALMRETYGGPNDRWFRGTGDRAETCFTARLDDTLAGVAWATIVGEHGRLHSLTVRPGYRGIGIGTDLLFARLLWAQSVGVGQVISEISEHNSASRAIAERGGMRPVGRIYLYVPR